MVEPLLAMTTSNWLPLGSATVIDWKHLGRPLSARNATAWVRAIEGEPVVVRTWGEDTTSSFDFVFLSDERIAGTVVVNCARADDATLRIKASLEIEGQVSFVDTNDFRENSRTMLMTHASRSFQSRQGSVSQNHVTRLEPRCAELFEVAPDSAMQTVCADWLASILLTARDSVRGVVATMSPAPAPVAAAPAPAAVAPTAQPSADIRRANDVMVRKNDGPAPRSATDHGRKEPARETVEANEIRVTPVDAARRTKQPDPGIPLPPREKVPARAPKLSCTTNTGETYDIADAETYIGRSKQCAIVLKSQRVSRKHACVTKEDDGFYINDLGAANGIWSGSEKIDRERIGDGDEFIVGDIVLTFALS